MMHLQNQWLKFSLMVLAFITLVYIALGFVSGDATQIDVGVRQAVFLTFVANVLFSRRRGAAGIVGWGVVLLTMTIFWPTLYRFGVDEEGTVYRVHRFNGSVESLYDECCPEWMTVGTEPNIVQWYP